MSGALRTSASPSIVIEIPAHPGSSQGAAVTVKHGPSSERAGGAAHPYPSGVQSAGASSFQQYPGPPQPPYPSAAQMPQPPYPSTPHMAYPAASPASQPFYPAQPVYPSQFPYPSHPPYPSAGPVSHPPHPSAGPVPQPPYPLVDSMPRPSYPYAPVTPHPQAPPPGFAPHVFGVPHPGGSTPLSSALAPNQPSRSPGGSSVVISLSDPERTERQGDEAFRKVLEDIEQKNEKKSSTMMGKIGKGLVGSLAAVGAAAVAATTVTGIKSRGLRATTTTAAPGSGSPPRYPSAPPPPYPSAPHPPYPGGPSSSSFSGLPGKGNW
ncbi:hypothetical protein CSUI_011094 [Cystoisospora suis]|uniref:Uncharacterized protein n=1 Tax=Cystoisospora suis TaxID=483139 RepID=A0A2C6KF26_9APIC|nr:hypothetical protein CSUI_011094 [Cystoisospora suis]